MIRVINIVDTLTQVNFGIWNAALCTSPALMDQHGVASEAWTADPSSPLVQEEYSLEAVRRSGTSGAVGLEKLMRESGVDTQNTVIVTDPKRGRG